MFKQGGMCAFELLSNYHCASNGWRLKGGWEAVWKRSGNGIPEMCFYLTKLAFNPPKLVKNSSVEGVKYKLVKVTVQIR
jgi:hypothetical protein